MIPDLCRLSYFDMKTFLWQDVSGLCFVVVTVYEFKIIDGKPNFVDQFKYIIKRYKKVVCITWIPCESLHAWL